MFKATDPTAVQYSRTAQQFTRQLTNLRLEGGVYIYELIAGGAAAQAGLAVGDIVIEYNGQTIKNMKDLTAVRDSTPKSQLLKVVYLRLESDGQFSRYTATVTHPMGAGFMPI